MYPTRRMRRLRRREFQPLFVEHETMKHHLVAPIFIDESVQGRREISSMPGQYRYSPAEVGDVAGMLLEKGIRASILFGVPSEKCEDARTAYTPEGVIQKAVRSIKDAAPEMVVFTDVCACEYTPHGHCGIVGETRFGRDLLNDPSLEVMDRIAVSHAEAGADIVAPSCMLDGAVKSIRHALDREGFEMTPIMSYSSKFASALYSPFREAADSCFTFGDRSTYQINPANGREALLESRLDMAEGADILMVKPAGYYLDILASVKELGIPVAVFQVSGEYAMIKAAAANGWIDEKKVVFESLLCMRRAGADLLITYFAEEAAGWLHG
ncbi:MAG: porphobilinogen synthase [Methanomicrobiales archaeon]|nr:porphobilinogen synthase [Methanomicrobiales archaeon]